MFNANNVYPDQRPLNAVFDLGLYCLPMSHFGTLIHSNRISARFFFSLYKIVLFSNLI